MAEDTLTNVAEILAIISGMLFLILLLGNLAYGIWKAQQPKSSPPAITNPPPLQSWPTRST